ncbi:MAG: CehA/McbA family metallohydrolase [Gemmatimonas sp.]|uniref:CehA/McbA family metallohydrolase n=1 Tax=Gemmatimonas sp. TaxID=1962908 RepID=UPI00391F4369
MPPRTRSARRLPWLAAWLLGAGQELAAQPARFVPNPPAAGARWLKGNTHTHTTNSDGDTPPEQVARWYKAHGYQFLVLSDHNVFTDPKTLASLMDSTFLLIPGEEVTTAYQRAPVHVNALDITRVIPAPTGATLLETLQRTIDVIRAERAVPHINHPNFRWSLDTAVLWRVRHDRRQERHNGHPTVHTIGGGEWPGMEEAWDALLTRGKRLYGIAVDDAHHFQGEFAADRANPGRGWVVVRTPALDGRAIVEALEAGHFYASSGPILDDITVTESTMSLHIGRNGDFRYTTTFIGANGRVLAVDRSLTPSYSLTGDEPYVRARVVDSGGRVAWVQPAFTTRYIDRPP